MNIKNLKALLEVEGIESKDGFVTLSQEQIEKIELKLESINESESQVESQVESESESQVLTKKTLSFLEDNKIDFDKNSKTHNIPYSVIEEYSSDKVNLAKDVLKAPFCRIDNGNVYLTTPQLNLFVKLTV